MLARLGRPFRVLALETSADDTCAAIVDASRRVWSNVVVPQNYIHEAMGGIQPMVALLAHQRNIPTVVQRALTEAKLEMADIDGVAFTRGPGIPGCLSVCLNAAKTLAAANNKPLVGVHHMQAHALTPHLTLDSPPSFPFLSVLVSGGHTMIVLVSSLVDFRILCNTVDRSIGATIDRVVTLLKIPWTDKGPGPGLEKFCAERAPEDSGPAPKYDPPVPMPGKLAFSYAGLHSWVERTVSAAGGVEHVNRHALARAFQNSAFEQLETKLQLALRAHGHAVRHVVVSGGVASNLHLRQRLKRSVRGPVEFIFPEPALCTDNAAMIAWASMHRFLAGDHDDYAIDPLPAWSLDELKNPPPNKDAVAAFATRNNKSTSTTTD
ncbi:tRNA N6-adenosine threonylcarbamoyltransferase, mitochondrial [Mycena venus]|uniref:N(6)-L-threonylcarbamoyladenine synthase n=1 Tax=Mycena venus TaxID=2733690 RepID=A0A8H7D7B2_9AGAR|nr:tRNA N6-adenosine threonylcarbamoyltransferase, mitochondrial [Mycena venus]